MKGEPIEIITSNPEREASLDFVKARQREITAELGNVNRKLEAALEALGQTVAEGRDPAKLIAEIARLRGMQEALNLGRDNLSGQAARLLRGMNWLRS